MNLGMTQTFSSQHSDKNTHAAGTRSSVFEIINLTCLFSKKVLSKQCLLLLSSDAPLMMLESLLA